MICLLPCRQERSEARGGNILIIDDLHLGMPDAGRDLRLGRVSGQSRPAAERAPRCGYAAISEPWTGVTMELEEDTTSAFVTVLTRPVVA